MGDFSDTVFRIPDHRIRFFGYGFSRPGSPDTVFAPPAFCIRFSGHGFFRLARRVRVLDRGGQGEKDGCCPMKSIFGAPENRIRKTVCGKPEAQKPYPVIRDAKNSIRKTVSGDPGREKPYPNNRIRGQPPQLGRSPVLLCLNT